MRSRTAITLFTAFVMLLSGCTQNNGGAPASAATTTAGEVTATTATTTAAETTTTSPAAADTTTETSPVSVPDLAQQTRLFRGFINPEGDTESLLAAPDDNAGTVVGDLTAGTILEIYTCDAEGWYLAESGGEYVGYIRQEKVAEMPHKLPFGDPLFGGYVAVDSDINLYSEADENSEVIRVLMSGTQIDVYESDYDGWYMTALPKEDGSGDFDYCFFRSELVAPIPDYDMDQPSGDANEYGFYPITDAPASGVSVAALSGTWYYDAEPSAHLIIREGADIYNGTFSYADTTAVAEGYVKLEYALEPDGKQTFWYTFYKNDGTFWNAFSVSGELPLNDLYAGQSGEPHFIRMKEPAVSDIAGVWNEADAGEARRLTVNEDCTYKLESGESITSGTIKIEYEEFPDGSTVPWFIFYDESGSMWEGFSFAEVQPQTDLYAGQTGSPHFVRES